MIGTPILEIPVYRVNLDSWSEEREKEWRRLLALMREPSDRHGGPVHQEILQKWRQQFEAEYPTWRYNDVIGWLSLDRRPDDIVGNLWLVKSKRISRRSRKVFRYAGDLFKIILCEYDDSQKVYAAIKIEIDLAAAKPPLRGRHIVLDGFLLLAPHVDWLRMGAI